MFVLCSEYESSLSLKDECLEKKNNRKGSEKVNRVINEFKLQDWTCWLLVTSKYLVFDVFTTEC